MMVKSTVRSKPISSANRCLAGQSGASRWPLKGLSRVKGRFTHGSEGGLNEQPFQAYPVPQHALGNQAPICDLRSAKSR
jgi:hypothetical protein